MLAAVGRLVLDGVAVVVVVVAVAVIALQAVAADGLLGCRVEDVVGGVEGEGLSSRPGDAAQRVVFERGRAAALVAAFGQVAVAVVMVAPFDGGKAGSRAAFAFCFDGQLAFQTA